jgi:ankyrin repeat protein
MRKTLARRLGRTFFFVIAAACSLAHAGSYDDFFRAIQQNDPVEIRKLLNRGFDANTLNGKSQHGLSIALEDGALKAAQALIDWPQTDVNKLSLKGESPLMLAALKGHLELAEMLIKKDADVNKTGWTPLHYAASAGHVEMIRLLLDNSAYIDAESPNGTTPLMMAALYGTPAAVDLLLQEGADPKLKNQQNLTALQFAQRGNRIDSVEAIAKFLRSKQPSGQW